MKALKLNYWVWALFVGLMFTSVACDDDTSEDKNPMEIPKSITDIAAANPDFSILVAALQQVNLADDLDQGEDFTVFAPTNEAFEKLFSALEISGLDELTKDDLTPILMAHVVNAHALSTGLSNGNIPTLNKDKKLEVSVDNGVTIDGEINVVATDIQGSNGVIHVIDAVIVP
nr:fasciclin domain-containing protein [uncultured Carboxylicivirga sp.]